MKFLTYITLWHLIQLLVEVNCQMTPYKNARTEHTSTLIDNKLYILGGISITATGTIDLDNKGFFYLDVSGPFNTKELPWYDLSSIDTVPPHYGAASVKGGANNDTLFLYGGYSGNNTMALVYTYNPQSSTWSTPIIAGVNTINKKETTGIIDRRGKMYIFGGWTGDIKNPTTLDDMLILDTVNLSWENGISVGAPAPRAVYGAVLLPDNNIIYMGK
jgi:hypothetical protein